MVSTAVRETPESTAAPKCLDGDSWAAVLVSAVIIAALITISALPQIRTTDWVVAVLAGLTLVVFAAVVTISQRRRFQSQLGRAGNQLADAMRSTGAVIQKIDLQTGEIIDIMGDVELVTGCQADRWRSRQGVHPDDLDGLRDAYLDLHIGGTIDRVVRYQDAVGTWRWIHEKGGVVLDHRGQPVLQTLLTDTSAFHQIADKLRDQARRDHVSGLLNRLAMDETLDRLAQNNEPFALLIVDVRQFKAINDTLGHHIGDLILTMLARRLIERNDPSHVFRLSADQFAVIATGITSDAEARAAGGAVALSCRAAHLVGRVSVAAPVAVGVARSSPNVEPTITLRHAETALRHAKTSQREVSMFNESMQRYTLDNLMLGAAVESAIALNQFKLYYQPQIDLGSNKIVGAEGLVRWHHPDRGLLTPGEFLEPLRLSASFDRFSLAMVRQCIDAAVLVQLVDRPLHFSVNIEMRSLLADGFIDRCIAELIVRDIGHNRIVLEVTETDFVQAGGSETDALAEFDRLRATGFELSIDDFGTGSSSLERLDKIPTDELKIDRSFVNQSSNGGAADVMISAMISLSHALGFRTVAEGVETQQHATFLKSAGCGIGQGFLFGKAMPLASLIDQIADRPDSGHVVPLHGMRKAGAAS